MALIKCPDCGKEISDKAKNCIHCGCPIEESKEPELPKSEEEKEEKPEKPVVEESDTNKTPEETKNNDTPEETKEVESKTNTEYVNIPVVNKKVDKKILISLSVIIIAIFLITVATKNGSKAIKVDISMNSWYGSIDDILDNFGIDFYAVTGGANCYSGVKTNKFETEKYGTLYTEFSYCKTTNTQRFRIYNIESDQPLREPKAGELPTYNSYGEKTTDSTM